MWFENDLTEHQYLEYRSAALKLQRKAKNLCGSLMLKGAFQIYKEK